MTVLKKMLLMSCLISVACGGHLQVENRTHRRCLGAAMLSLVVTVAVDLECLTLRIPHCKEFPRYSPVMPFILSQISLVLYNFFFPIVLRCNFSCISSS